MRFRFFLFVCCAFTTTAGFSQGLTIDPVVGFGISDLVVAKNVVSAGSVYNPGYSYRVGALVSKPLKSGLAISGGVRFARFSQRYNFDDEDLIFGCQFNGTEFNETLCSESFSDLKFISSDLTLEVPILLRMSSRTREHGFYGQIGVVPAYLLASKSIVKSDGETDRQNAIKPDRSLWLSGSLDVGYNFLLTEDLMGYVQAGSQINLISPSALGGIRYWDVGMQAGVRVAL